MTSDPSQNVAPNPDAETDRAIPELPHPPKLPTPKPPESPDATSPDSPGQTPKPHFPSPGTLEPPI